jgi:hypothetical protein
MTSERTYQIIIGVLVLIIIIGGWFMFARSSTSLFSGVNSATTTSSGSDSANVATSTSAAPAASSAQMTQATTAGSGESVEVYDQAAGKKVAVQSLTLNQPSWVAVRDASGRILGAGWFPAGTQKNVSVSLLRATAAGQRYQVLLYADDGDRKFDLHKDTLLTEADGSVAGTTFTAK